MKYSLVALVTVFGYVSAGRPQLSIQVRDGSFSNLDGLEPCVSWETSTKSGDLDLECGVDLAARATGDLSSLPKKIWGKASRDFAGWGVSARAEVQGTDFSNTDLELSADNVDNDLSVKLLGSAGADKGVSIAKIEATKGIDTDDARLTINPRYNLDTSEADVVVGYKRGDTEVEVTASQDDQKVLVSQQIDDNNCVSPTLSSNGDISVAWERSLGDDGSVTTTVRPNESVDVEWKDSAWTANINVPIDGTSVQGTNVSIKREVTF